jgi:hypothetical protein
MRKKKWMIVVIAIVVATLHHRSQNNQQHVMNKKHVSMPVAREEDSTQLDFFLPDIVMWYVLYNYSN